MVLPVQIPLVPRLNRDIFLPCNEDLQPMSVADVSLAVGTRGGASQQVRDVYKSLVDYVYDLLS